MSFLVNQTVDAKQKSAAHPWKKTIKSEHANLMKHSHNSINNPVYPKPRENLKREKRGREGISPNKMKFSVFGDRCSREFIVCKKLVEGLYTYRSKEIEAPVVQGWILLLFSFIKGTGIKSVISTNYTKSTGQPM